MDKVGFVELWSGKQEDALKKIVFLLRNNAHSDKMEETIIFNSWKQAVVALTEIKNKEIAKLFNKMSVEELVFYFQNTKASLGCFKKTIKSVLETISKT